MANVLTPVDVYTIVNEMNKNMFGSNALTAVDTSSFVTVGEAMLRSGVENTLNALGLVVGRTVVAVRPYDGMFRLTEFTDDSWGAIQRKISYYWDGCEQATDWNTDKAPEQLKDGNSVDMYKIHKRYPLEIRFCGLKVLQKSYTTWLYQLERAFKSEAEFSAFFVGQATEVRNELNMIREAENRLTVLNAIGATYNTGTAASKRNLTKLFNDEHSTTYTTAQLLNEHIKEFTEFYIVQLKNDMDMLKGNHDLYHLTPAKNDDAGQPLKLLRHTPMEYQRLYLYKPLVRKTEARVMAEIFNDNYLQLPQYEGVMYWQNPSAPAEVNVTPNQLNITDGSSKTGDAVDLKQVVGLLYDRDAIGTHYHIDRVLTTPVNANGAYYNTVYHWAKDHQLDQTENIILYYMEDAEV